MKKLLWTLAALLGFVILGLAIFLVTFDADRYRPLILRKLEEAIGRPVQLDRVSLGLRQGIALELKGLAVFDDPTAAGEPALRMDAASAVVRLAPLLSKRVEVSSVMLLHPQIRIFRDAQGQVSLFGLAAAASPAAASQQRAPEDETAVSFAVDSVRIENGSLHWTDAASHPPADLWLKRLSVTARNIAPGQPLDLELSGALGGDVPNLRLSGRLTPPAASHPGSLDRLELSVTRLPLKAVAPPVAADAPQLQGLLTLAFEGAVPTLEPSAALRTATGSGRVELTEAVVVNLNILREVFNRLAMIPGLVETLQARLPADYQAKFDAKNTVLAPIDLPVTVDGGALRFTNLEIRTETLSILGLGTIGLDGTVNVPSRLRIEPAFSEAIIRSVNELQALANAKGELEIPGTIQGRLPHITFVPDVKYVA